MLFSKKSLILATAVCALAGVSSALNAADVVAKVNGKDITTTELEQFKQALPKELLEKVTDKSKLKKDMINQLVDFHVLVDAAMKSDVQKSKEVEQALVKAKEQVVVQAFLMSQLKAKLNDQAVEAKYKELKDKFPKDKKETKARHILVKDEAAAKDIITKLKAGEDFQKLAREKSEDKESGKDGGDLGYFVDGSFDPEFEKAATGIQPGKFTETPVKTQFGYHVIKIEDRRAAKAPKLEDVKQQLAGLLQQEAMIDLVKRLRDKATVEILDKEALTAAKDEKPATAVKKEDKKEDKKA